jgi:putative addiction module antidote
MLTLKLIQIGNSVGVILPKEVLSRLKIGKGDTVAIVWIDKSAILAAHDEQLAICRWRPYRSSTLRLDSHSNIP